MVNVHKSLQANVIRHFDSEYDGPKDTHDEKSNGEGNKVL